MIGLSETWVEEENWNRMKKRLPGQYVWRCIPARREYKKGRAKGGIITAVNKNLEEIGYRELGGNGLLTGADYNARTGSRGGPIDSEVSEEGIRKSKDKVVNRERRILVEKLEERGWIILNGSCGKEGGWTYIGENGVSVIDYIVSNEKGTEEVEGIEEGERTESDHVPLEVRLKGPETRLEGYRVEAKEIEKSDWTNGGIEHYHRECEGWTSREEEIEGKWREIKDKVKKSIKKERKKIWSYKLGKRIWHSKEWKERKRELRKDLRKWMKGEISREEYVGKRKEYKEWCEGEKRRHEKEEEEKLRNIRTEAEAWKYINKYRRKREGIDESIKMEEWRRHFMEVLGRVEQRGGRKEEEERQIIEEEEEEEEGHRLKYEFIEQFKKLKKNKAPGKDEIENEAWKYMSNEVGEEMLKLIRKIWKEGGIPEDWKKGLIAPIYKKGEKEKVCNYRWVTLMDSAYKIYASMLNKKLMKEAEEKLAETQMGFRKGRGVIDAIYILNWVVNKELSKPRGKIFAFFADLKGAFDTVNRRVLKEKMVKMGISNKLETRIMETYEETKCMVRIGKERSEEFLVEKGVRQGCPMSPTLFNIFLGDLEEEMKKGQEGGVVVGKEKFWTITYADDLVLLAKSEEELEEMMKRFKKYLEKNSLTLSPEKSKVLVFEKGKGKKKRREWRWGKERIEEVKEIRYLGYMLQKNGGAEVHIRERIRRAMVAMKKTWSIGERIFKSDYVRRMKMFKTLVGSVALFGAEKWGWHNEERLDRIQTKYVKWILGLERQTPNYIVAEECKLAELRMQAIGRAIKYEEKARKSGKKIVVECIKQLEKERLAKEEGVWERKRRETMERMGLKKEELRRRREEEQEIKEIVKWVGEVIENGEMEERRKKIEESKYNTVYKTILEENLPKYLKERRNIKEQRLLARYRCGNETRAGHYWRKTEERLCRMCGEKEESLMHVLRECTMTKCGRSAEEVLAEDEKGLEELRRIEGERRRQEEMKEKEREEGM